MRGEEEEEGEKAVKEGSEKTSEQTSRESEAAKFKFTRATDIETHRAESTQTH